MTSVGPFFRFVIAARPRIALTIALTIALPIALPIALTAGQAFEWGLVLSVFVEWRKR